jgi:4-diphosphocytidyl-2-C-methyl-D-erythritol kinase
MGWIVAPAKINLYLRILGRRSDGYHELESLILPLDLADRIRIHRLGPPDRISVEAPGHRHLENEDNLVVMAVRWFQRNMAPAGTRESLIIHIEKHIPEKAGLGGGSSDAAAVLRYLCHLHSVPIQSLEADRLCEEIGADVPFFLACRPAWVQGRGERVSFLNGLKPFPVCCATPSSRISTSEAFRALDAPFFSRGRRDDRSRAAPPSPRRARELIEQGRNDLWAGALLAHPQLADLRADLLDLGARVTVMSGSGSTIVGLFDTTERARRAAARLKKNGVWSRACLAGPLEALSHPLEMESPKKG